MGVKKISMTKEKSRERYFLTILQKLPRGVKYGRTMDLGSPMSPSQEKFFRRKKVCNDAAHPYKKITRPNIRPQDGLSLLELPSISLGPSLIDSPTSLSDSNTNHHLEKLGDRVSLTALYGLSPVSLETSFRDFDLLEDHPKK